MAADISNMLSKNVILIDADYINKVASSFSDNFTRVLMRDIPKAQLPLWLDCIALDGGIQIGENDIQVIFVYKQPVLSHFVPSNLKDDIDGKAFKDNLGEFTMEAYNVEQSVTTMGTQFADTLHVLLNAEKVETILIVPNTDEYGDELSYVLKDNKTKKVAYFSIAPQEGEGFCPQQLGFSLLHAMGIKSSELQ